jgi:hypothetical protein
MACSVEEEKGISEIILTVSRIRTIYVAFKYCPCCVDAPNVVFEFSERNVSHHLSSIRANHLLFLCDYKWYVAMETPDLFVFGGFVNPQRRPSVPQNRVLTINLEQRAEVQVLHASRETGASSNMSVLSSYAPCRGQQSLLSKAAVFADGCSLRTLLFGCSVRPNVALPTVS